ncbi:trypsin-1-like [Uranotaenia lowii]|uniref:trypsin-1-like n=1 Tax=Uranotaenia lowii TaxID=190385 RepID=UPI002479D0EA|nr:trypsin-1-like [Uranotaenia lowii]
MMLVLTICAAFGASLAFENNPQNPRLPWNATNRRIVGGFEISIEEVPWQVSLYSYYHFCGGSIIGTQWVLTAGHCSESSNNPGFSIHIGSSNNQRGRKVDLKRAIRHHKYNSNTLDYDFTLLETAEKLSYSQSVKAIALPKQDEFVAAGSMCTTSGWGSTQNDWEDQSVLRAANLPTIGYQDCDENYAYLGGITPRMICAGYWSGGISACFGDSGGPLVFQGKLIGVTSWVIACVVDGYPGAYGRVAAVRDWIRDVSGI